MTVTAVINGVSYTLAYNAVSGYYESAITAPSDSGAYTAAITVSSRGAEYSASAAMTVIDAPTIYDADIYLLNASFAICGLIDRYTSFALKRSYYTTGTFSLTLHPSYFSDVAAAAYLYHLGADVCCIIDAINIRREGAQTLTVRGRMLEGLFARRVLTAAVNKSGNIETSARSLITANALTGSRAFGGLTLDAAQGYTETADVTVGVDTLDSALYKLLQAQEMSYYIRYSMSSARLSCGIYRGADRSYIIFSTSFGNLRSAEYETDKTDYANVFYLQNGETVTEIDLSNGTERREAFVSATDITGLEGSALTAALTARAKEAAAERKAIETLTGTAEIGEPAYRIDYSLGDKVTMRDDDLGITIAKRITEIDEVWEASEPKIYPTFGDVPDMSIKRLIKQKGII